MHALHGNSPFERIASYSRATRAGDLVSVAGTAATNSHGEALHPGDAAAQTRAALLTALDAAAALGAQRSDVVRTRLFLVPDADWRAAVGAHGEVFAGVFPANTTLFVAGLIPQDCLVEVEVDAIATGPVTDRADTV